MNVSLRAVLMAGLVFAPQVAFAQSLSLSSKNDPDKPITVTADNGLEWQQDNKKFIARGNAKAVQGDETVTGDELIAHYRDKPKTGALKADGTPEEGASEVYRVDATGKVTITSKDEVATGETAVYDFDHKTLVMEGPLVTLTTKDGVVSAHRTLQYWSEQNVAVAEGDALAVDMDPKNGGRKIKADKLTAFFRDTDTGEPAPASGKTAKKKSNDPNHGRDLIYLQGVGGVVLTTKTEVVRGDRANYNLDTGMATVEGNVKMTRDNNQMNGGYAVVNVKGGVSRVYGSAAEAKGAGNGAVAPPRVSALLTPKNEDKPAEADPLLRPTKKNKAR